MAIQIDFLANVRDFLNGTKSVGSALDDVSGSLDDLARDAQRAGQKTGDGISDGAKDAGTATERLERSFKDLSNTVQDESKRAGRSLGDETKTGAKEASEGVSTMKEETQSEVREMAASFGSVEDALSSVQAVAANALGGFGPVGAAAGAALAVGFGLATAALQTQADQINANKQAVGELATEMADAGGALDAETVSAKMRDWATGISDNKEWWEVWQKDAVSNLDVAKDAAHRAGVSVVQSFRAMSGFDAQAAVGVTEKLRAKSLELQKQLDKMPQGEQADARVISLQSEIKATDELVRKINQQNGITGDAAQVSKVLAEATKQETDAAKAQADAQEAAAKATQVHDDRVRSLQGGLDAAIGAYGDFKDKETEKLDPKGYIKSIQDRIDATSNFNGNVQKLATDFGLSQDEIQAILDQGVDFGPMLQKIMSSGMAPAFVEQIKKAVGGGQEILDGTPLGTTVDVDADLSKAEKKTDATTKKDLKSEVKVDADTKPAEKSIQKVVDKDWKTTVTVDADVAAARRAISGLERSITLRATVVDRNGKVIL